MFWLFTKNGGISNISLAINTNMLNGQLNTKNWPYISTSGKYKTIL